MEGGVSLSKMRGQLAGAQRAVAQKEADVEMNKDKDRQTLEPYTTAVAATHQALKEGTRVKLETMERLKKKEEEVRGLKGEIKTLEARLDNMANSAMSLPPNDLGALSPYPTVVAVTVDHHSPSQIPSQYEL